MAELAENKCQILNSVVNTRSMMMCYINVRFTYLLTYRTDNNGTGCKQQLEGHSVERIYLQRCAI